MTAEARPEGTRTAHLPPDIKHRLRAEALSIGKTVSSLVREWMALCAYFVMGLCPGFAIKEHLDSPVAA